MSDNEPGTVKGIMEAFGQLVAGMDAVIKSELPAPLGSVAWVSVDDALPPWKEYVLAYMPWNGGDRYIIVRRLPSRAKNQEWQESSNGCTYRYGVQKRGHGQSITHWMKLTPPNPR